MDDEKQIIPFAKKTLSNVFSDIVTKDSDSNMRKLTIENFLCDNAKGYNFYYNSGAKNIRVREDIVADLLQIKQHLNDYDIPFTCEFIDVSLKNEYISDLARVGLEIKLNKNAGLNKNSSYDNDDYFVGPHLSLSSGNKIKIYGLVRRVIEFEEFKYKPQKKIYDIYDVSGMDNTNPPKIRRIFKNLLDITQIFEDYGFYQYNNYNLFLRKGDINEFNWNVFYKKPVLKLGITYKSLLESVYTRNNEKIWLEEDRYWDGEKFNVNK